MEVPWRDGPRPPFALDRLRERDREHLIYDPPEVFPLVCPGCGGAMRIIAFITGGPTVRDILGHLGAPTAPPRIAPARGPPLSELPPAAQRELDPQAQPAPAYEFDQRSAW